jgi:hypothetical protein
MVCVDECTTEHEALIPQYWLESEVLTILYHTMWKVGADDFMTLMKLLRAKRGS